MNNPNRKTAMKSVFSHTFILFCFISASVLAQERDFLKDLLKESLKESIKNTIQSEMKIDPLSENLIPDSTWKTIEINVNKKPLPRMGFNHKLNSFIWNYKDSLPLGPEYTISPDLLAALANWKQEEYDRTSTETAGDILANAFLRPIASIVMINPIAFFTYLMDIGLLPNDPLPPRLSKHEKAKRYITKEVYPHD